MLAKAKAKAAGTAEELALAATEFDQKHGVSKKVDVVSELAKKEAKEFDARHSISEKAEAAKAAAAAKAAQLDEKHQVSERAAAAKAAASAKAAQLDEKHQVSERAVAAKAAAAAKAAELDEKHQISERAATVKATAAAKAAGLDQKLGEKITVKGFVGHASAVQIDLNEGAGKESVDEWIAWSQTAGGLASTKEAKGCCSVQLYRGDSGLFLYEEWDQLSSQMRYLEKRRFPGELPAEIQSEAPELLDASSLALPFGAPKINTLSACVDWPITARAAPQADQPCITLCRTVTASDAAKYEELVAWSLSKEDGLAFTAAQPGAPHTHTLITPCAVISHDKSSNPQISH